MRGGKNLAGPAGRDPATDEVTCNSRTRPDGRAAWRPSVPECTSVPSLHATSSFSFATVS
jgi:hypothetical protein